MESKDFEALGLNRNEARVYHELLKLNNSTASDLVKRMGVHRNIVYDNLEKLIEKGLASYIIQETKKLFIAQEPSAILDYLDKKEEEISKEKVLAKKLIVEIQHLKMNERVEQEAQIFRGAKGMKKVLSEILKAEENLVLGMTNRSTELLGETYWKNFNTKIKAKKIKQRLLVNSAFTDIYSFGKKRNVKVRTLPKEFDQVTEIVIFGENVAIFVYSNKPLVFLIKDKHLHETYVKQFEYLWNKSQK